MTDSVSLRLFARVFPLVRLHRSHSAHTIRQDDPPLYLRYTVFQLREEDIRNCSQLSSSAAGHRTF